MTVNVVLTSSRIDAAPGDIVDLPLRLTNTADSAASCRITIVGLDPADESRGEGDRATTGGRPGYDVVVAAGETVEVLSPVAVPWALGIGDHTAAIEVESDRPGDRPVLLPFVISIGSVARVELLALPSTMRGHRRTKFKLDVLNNEAVPVDLVISAEAPEVQVRFSAPAMRLQPGERALTKAEVKGPRHWSGEPTQHTLVITASGRASSTSTTAAYIQRPLFAHRARMILAGLTVVAVWLAAIGGMALWLSNRSDDRAADDAAQTEVIAVDTDGDGVADQFTLPDGTVVTGVDTDGDGKADAFFDAAGNPVPDPTAGGDGSEGSGGDGSGSGGSGGDEAADGADGSEGSTTATSALLRGTVTAEGDPSDITITLTPIALGATPDPAAIQGFVGPQQPEATKIWSARALPPGAATLNPVRQTEAVTPLQATPASDGVWQIPNVELRHSYQIVFAKPGYDTQSFVVTPPEDGSPLELDVELVPATGSIGGTVRGPNGPLGGAEIVVTDGVLTFTTTAATVGAVGTWSVDQVSTPGVYTVSATLTGYGTEVRQVTLKAGDKFPSADLTMKRGVGSVSGRVTGPDGQPIGGVTITATNGDESRTTSSLTEGDIGSYNIPQLTMGATFTLLVTAPGYLDESRRTPVNGAASGINFGLTKTTLTLTGTVTSGTTGVGVANAGLTLTTGDLTFRASTAGGANRGTFAIDDLPPGNYTVTVDHYQHVPSTQLITLTAGVPPPPLDIALERGSGLPALGTGTLVVEVVDTSGKTAETRQIKNATVRLIRTQTGEELPATTQEAFNFRIENVPIGTYTLLVTAPRYNPAPPRQVSVGLSQSRVEVQMQRLGQASGYVVDSLTKAKLNNYFVNIYRQPESPGQSPNFVIQGDTSTGLWQTPVDSLVPGTYRVEITDSNSPPGYLVRDDQVLDPAVVGVGAERNMKFVVPEGSVDPISVGSIEADPYPTITGRVYKPAMPPDSVDIVPIDSPDLTVTLACPGGTTVSAQPLDLAGVVGDSPKLYDSFVITKVQVDAANLTGDCTLDAIGGAGFAPNSAALPGVEASNGVSSPDRRVHMVLGPPAPSIGGKVFWNDGVASVPINNATITSTRATSYSVVENPGDNVPPSPVPTSGSAMSNADGAGTGNWKLDGQIIGVAPYVFAAPDFATGTIQVKVDPTGTATATSGAGAVVAPGSGGTFDVRLSAPTPRDLTGVITVLTNRPAASIDFAAVHITATRGAVTIDESTVGPTTIVRGTPVGKTLPFTVVGAEPGQWSVAINVPAHHVEFGDSIPADEIVVPGSTPVPGFDMSIAELGTLKLTLVDGASPTPNAITTAPSVTLTPVGGGTPITGTAVHVVGDPSNVFTVDNIPVSVTSNPATTDRAYKMTLTLAGYDLTTVNADDGSGIPGTTINVRAGSTTTQPLTLPKFGTITGDVEGIIGGSSNALITLCDPASPTYATCTNGKVTASPVTSSGGPLAPGDPNYGLVPTITVSANQYTISGPPGYYELTVTHPQYEPQTDPDTVIPGDNFSPPVPTPPASGASAVLRIVNDRPNLPTKFALQIIQGNLDLSVYRTIDSGVPGDPVTNAQYTLTPAINLTNTGTIINGTVIGNLYPGTYQLQIREFDTAAPFDEIAFPVITNIVINKANILTGDPSTTTVVAPLPLLAPSITGSIQGRNLDGQPVALPATAASYVVTGNFPAPILSGDPIPDPMPTTSNASINPGSAATGTVNYSFTNVPVGEHQLTLTVDATALKGYTLVPGSATKPLTVIDPGTTFGPNYQLTVGDVDFKVTLAPGDYPRLRPGALPSIGTMRLTSPSGAKYGNTIPTPTVVTFDDSTDTITFAGVAPELGSFTLEVVDDLHAPLNTLVPVNPDLDGDATLVSTYSVAPAPAAGAGRLSGTAKQRESSVGTGDDLALPATITVTRTGSVGDCAVACPVVFTGGQYTIDLAPGAYQIVTSKDGFQTQSLNVTVTGGRITTPPPNVSISKLATFEFTVQNAPLPTGTTMLLSDGTINYPSTTETLSDGKTKYTFKVPAQTPAGVQKNYTATAQAPGYAPKVLPATDSTYAPDIGSLTSAPILLAPRVFEVAVTAADTTPTTTPPGTEVKALFGPPPPPLTLSSPPFIYSSAAIPSMPLSETGTAVADAPGFRANSATIPVSTSAPIEIVVRPTVTVTGTVTKPVGTAALPAGTKVTATAPGMSPLEANVTVDSVSGNGSYTLAGLDVGLTLAGLPDPKTWTLTYDVVGVGKQTLTTNVTSTSPTAVTLNFVPVRQPINVVFTVIGPNTGGTVAVTFSGETNNITPSTPTGTSTTIVALENETVLGYTVDGPGYIVKTGTVTFAANRGDTAVPVTVALRPPITGTVKTAAAVAVGDATVRVCALPVGMNPCGSGLASTTSDTTTGAFSIPTYIAPGDYAIWATKTTNPPGPPPDSVTVKGYRLLTVNADHTYVITAPPADSVITVT